MDSPTSGEVDCALLKEWTLRVFSCAQDSIEPINISEGKEEEKMSSGEIVLHFAICSENRE